MSLAPESTIKTHIDAKKRLEQTWNDDKIIRLFIKKFKGKMGETLAISKLNQPCIFLLRKGRRAEFLEANNKNGLKEGVFRFTHSNGKEREVLMTDSCLYEADYGKKDSFKLYIMHEDWARPMPHENIVTFFESWKSSIEHTFSAEMKWKAQEKAANAKIIAAITTTIAVALGGFLLYIVLKKPEPAEQAIVTVFQNVSTQATMLIGGLYHARTKDNHKRA